MRAVTQPSSRPTWQPKYEKIGATAIIVGLALVKLGQRILDKR